MSDAKAYPPGPWDWTYDGSSDYSVGQADDPQAKPVAHVHSRNPDRGHAICALLSASPDMVDALERLLMDTCEGDIGSVPEASDGRFVPADTLRRCAAVLAKALQAPR